MADHQRIHPVQDPEAPLVPQGAFRSDKGSPARGYPPFRRTIPVTQSRPPKRGRSCCFKCFCWTISLIFLLFVIIAILAAVFFLVFQPKLPKYSIDKMRITQFNLNNDMSLFATFNVNITARNPNKKIGIYYEEGSNIKVFFKGVQLCEGSWPKFFQDQRNTTVLDVPLTGQTQNATELLQSVQAQQQQTGSIPLNVRVKVPVKIKLGSLKLMKWNFLVRCEVAVDSLTANNDIRISSSKCKFRLRL